MKRSCLTAVAVLALWCSVGCCYRPGGINPYNGIAYGGRWEPMRGGPLDVTACYGPNFCPTVPTDCCWNVCEPPCATPAVGPYMMGQQDDCCESGTPYPQTFVPSPHVMPHESVPGGAQPVPDPNMHRKSPKNGGATTYVVPQQLQFHNASPVEQASSVPWVQAH